MDEIIAQLVAGGVVDRSRLQGCSEAEIAAIEHERGVALPGAYRTFLAAMGKSPGGFLRGSDLEYSALRSLRAWAEELTIRHIVGDSPKRECNREIKRSRGDQQEDQKIKST